MESGRREVEERRECEREGERSRWEVRGEKWNSTSRISPATQKSTCPLKPPANQGFGVRGHARLWLVGISTSKKAGLGSEVRKGTTAELVVKRIHEF